MTPRCLNSQLFEVCYTETFPEKSIVAFLHFLKLISHLREAFGKIRSEKTFSLRTHHISLFIIINQIITATREKSMVVTGSVHRKWPVDVQ